MSAYITVCNEDLRQEKMQMEKCVKNANIERGLTVAIATGVCRWQSSQQKAAIMINLFAALLRPVRTLL